MTTRANHHDFVPPPHANARSHQRVMDLMEKMTPEEALALSVSAGIHTPDGKLTAPYKPAPDAARRHGGAKKKG